MTLEGGKEQDNYKCTEDDNNNEGKENNDYGDEYDVENVEHKSDKNKKSSDEEYYNDKIK